MIRAAIAFVVCFLAASFIEKSVNNAVAAALHAEQVEGW